MERDRWIEQVRDARRFRDYFPEQLQLLRVHPGAQSAQASDVAAGPGQARDEPRPDRVADIVEEDGDRRRRVLQRRRMRRS